MQTENRGPDFADARLKIVYDVLDELKILKK